MIINKYNTVGIVSDADKLKLAAILFDSIIPIGKEHNIPEKLISKIPIDYSKVEKLIEIDKEKHGKGDITYLTDRILPEYFEKQNVTDIERDKVIEILENVFNEGYKKVGNLSVLELSKQVNKENNLGIPIFDESILLEKLIEDYKFQKSTNKLEIEIINAPVINTESLEWNQILQAKQDSDFIDKVKRFGLFINKNYQGKDISFISDDLQIQTEDYKNACKKHGIDLVNGTLKSLTNSKSLFGTLGIVFGSIMLGTPGVAAIGGLVGGFLEIGKLGVNIKEHNDKFNSFVSASPISLIVELEKMQK
ncbi:hypothetical protein SAMN04488007_3482 [Maribacter aquivivus]|uniref:Uncharacterized protein n=1 Tax=Maribacter aquivivus TaxID=228958 RepID=A0A1M6U487_9FLAO|nr:hypothetical protein [Maribacter aquivivus]SHK64092.1 hypothetical protein SAMN04488007_3482 [Maribacter aquivivus]